jgi:hypothetical protein
LQAIDLINLTFSWPFLLSPEIFTVIVAMPFLLSLPAEIVQIILDFIEPGDIPSLSSSCKSFQALARDRLAEHKRFSKVAYKGRIDLPSANTDIDNNGLCAFASGTPMLLLIIAGNPRIAWYIECLRVPSLYSELMGILKIPDLTAELNVVRQVIHSSPFIREGERDDWMQAIREGKDGALLALLLAQLPRLKCLTLADDAADPIIPYVTCLISRAAARSRRGYLSQPLSALQHASIKYISHLDEDNEPELDSNGEEMPPPILHPEDHPEQLFRLLKALTTLPDFRHLSLQDYEGSSIDQDQYNPEDWEADLDMVHRTDPLASRSSQPKSITIDRGRISASELSVILKDCAALEDFRYLVNHTPEVFGSAVLHQEPSPDFAMSSIYAVLLAHARSSLKSLHVEIAHYGGRCSREDSCSAADAPPTINWNLHQFASLERIVLDIDLFSPESGGWLSFAETLPVPIKEICILAKHSPPGADRADVQAMLRHFRPQSFPNLQSLTLWHRNHNDYYWTGQYGFDHIIPIFRSALLDAGVSSDEVHDYHLPDEFFAARMGALCHDGYEMRVFGVKDVDIYALPPKDTAGHLIMGVYHATGTKHKEWRNLFDGVRVRKTW